MKRTYEKLVRDGIPARLDAAGVRYEIRTASPDEIRGLLLNKLREEVAELLAAVSDDDALDEIADISEVLAAIVSHSGASAADASARRRAKLEARGGFERGIVLLWTETPESKA